MLMYAIHIAREYILLAEGPLKGQTHAQERAHLSRRAARDASRTEIHATRQAPAIPRFGYWEFAYRSAVHCGSRARYVGHRSLHTSANPDTRDSNYKILTRFRKVWKYDVSPKVCNTPSKRPAVWKALPEAERGLLSRTLQRPHDAELALRCCMLCTKASAACVTESR